MKRNLFFTIICLLTALAYSCKEDSRMDLVDANAPAPAQLMEVQVNAQPGAAVITYKIPADPNFAYAKAVYEIRPGVYREAKASRYTDTLALVGFGDTLSHEVKLFSVGKNEKESAPLALTVTPLRPVVQSVFEDLTLDATFGGVQLTFKNPTGANLAIELLVDTAGTNNWVTVNTFYTGATEGGFSARGFSTAEKKFAVYVRDRWQNKSDTLTKSLSPIFEESIPKDTWKALRLPTDTWQPAESYVLEKIYDGNFIGYAGLFASTNASVLPQWFTLDLGKKVIISRIRMHHHDGSHLYKGSAVKTFELWGSNNPDPDGGWTNWEKLGTFSSFKPSGLPLGVNSAEDKNYGNYLGEEFAFDRLLPAMRYIRWKTLETYGSSGQVVIAEIDLYGQIQP